MHLSLTTYYNLHINDNHFSLFYYDGMLRVNTCKLEAGQEFLQENSSLCKDHIKQSMKENPFVKGAPLVAVVDVAKADFDKNRVSP